MSWNIFRRKHLAIQDFSSIIHESPTEFDVFPRYNFCVTYSF